MGQVAASLPLLLVTVWIARAGTLEGAGRFTVVVGVSAASFSAALWGLRTTVVIDQFREFSPTEYVKARATSLTLAALITVGGGLWMGVAGVLLVLVITLRTTDALADLMLAFLQVRVGTDAALRLFALIHLFKLALICTPLVTAVLFDFSSVEEGLLFAALLTLLVICVSGVRSGLLRVGARDGGQRVVHRILALFGRSKWFALAVVSCSVLTSTPRIIVPVLYQDDMLGVVGVSLSVSTFFGMVFFTTWLRSLPRFEASHRTSTVLRSYVLEWLVVGILLVVAARIVLPPVVAHVFDFPDPSFAATCSAVLLAGVAFAAGMTLTNLYKLTPWPWMESVIYLVPIGLLGAVMTFSSWPGSIPALLLLAGLILFTGSLPAVHRLATT